MKKDKETTNSKQNQSKQDPEKVRCKFWKTIYKPMLYPFYHLRQTFIWFMFVLVASQFGTIFNIIQRCVFDNYDISVSLGIDSSSGVFYTYSLVMIASLIAPLFIKTMSKETPSYQNIYMPFITLLFFTIVFCAVFYAFSPHENFEYDWSKLKGENMTIDWPQLIFFILAIIFSWYAYGLSWAPEHENETKLADNYTENENSSVNHLSNVREGGIPTPNVATLSGKQVTI